MTFDLFLLTQVHLMVAVVGRLFQKWFPAQPNLSYTFIWDKTDAYGQRVYGLSEAVGESVFRFILKLSFDSSASSEPLILPNSFKHQLMKLFVPSEKGTVLLLQDRTIKHDQSSYIC